MEIRELALSELQEASVLMGRVFLRFDAKDCEEKGISTFLASIEPENLKLMVIKDEVRFYGLFQDGGGLAGVLGARGNYLAFLFIHEEYMNLGHGRNLLDYYVERLREGEEGYGSIWVNSSLLARDFYVRQGFAETGERIEIFGIPYIPMERRL